MVWMKGESMEEPKLGESSTGITATEKLEREAEAARRSGRNMRALNPK
jgi:hypothetical protein